MKLQVLVSTMYQPDYSLIQKMNIRTDAVVINQSNCNEEKKISTEFGVVDWFSMREKGLSRSRNAALNKSNADIVLIADDDVTYYDNYKNIILDAYKRYPKADIIAFYVKSTDNERPTSKPLKEGYISYINSMKISSIMITIKPDSLNKQGISFNENFGAGSGKYSMGEENILLFHCLKKRLKIVYINDTIGKVSHNQSTWWNGVYTPKLMEDRGAIFYEMSHLLSIPFILQYAIRKHSQYKKDMTFCQAIKYMLIGRKHYILFLHNGVI